MTDQRPQYGELATPEEQRRAAGLPPLDEVAVAPPTPSVAPTAAAASPAPGDGSTTRRRPVDRLVTIALLAYGLVNVIVTGLSYLDLPNVMNETMRILGIDGEFTNFAQGRTWGTIGAIVLAVGWAITAALSIRRLRRGRLTWWLPIVGAIVTGIIVSMCIAVPMMSDPAFTAYLTSVGP
ncbi:DUF6264 family protein [Microbacterium sp. KSW4-16]|uniref:DUF6264 family protein n=1 Tax=Microbacterium TaxID=33882 RepID=UPI00103F5DE9|nr:MULTISPECIES: DUF6264 family protein [Microbacterium]MCK8466593.1 DUF6264 family protein [Microbacterium aurugineum]QEA28979.1 hypothetical protein FGL91_10665 [Microbacterium sp. CBA3102]TCJ27869.1 hypothetical protein E0W80_07070 [Microbacterium sp. PI-1]